ncbi:MFS transporter [Oscillibacter hominis]|uniref:MFS transporter n=1 Tax=Oscillibacter hominis TaxID=2763056 RepID=A0A7G9B4Z3_9FIRM|nr:MFS transporter [Oscillibacter hominis]QNL44624.1 MFS transporter [Oscillibacter hominis]
MNKQGSNKWYWIIAASLFLVMMFNCGLGFYSLSLFVTPITRSFGISSGDFAMLYVFYGVGSAAAAAFFHSLLKRFALKSLIVSGGLISAAGYFVFAGSDRLEAMFLGGVLIGASTVFSGTAAVQMAIARWFSERRSQITGLVASASGVGTAVGSPIVGWMIHALGWRAACVAIGALVAVFVCVQIALLFREEPGCVGLAPYGESQGAVKGEMVVTPGGGCPLREGIKRPAFWLFAGGMSVVAVVYQMISLYQSTILIERGVPEAVAAACLSVFAVVDMCSKASAGIIADRFGFRIVTLYCAGATALAFLLIRVVDGTVGAVLFSALLGFWPTMCVLYGVTASISLFGKRYLSEYIGFSQTLMCCCSLVGMPLIRTLYNAVGSFDTVMNIAVGLLAAFAVMMTRMLREANFFREKTGGRARPGVDEHEDFL